MPKKYFINQDYCSIKGKKRKNEDFFYIDDTVMIVGDGASGIGIDYMDDELSDAAWFSRNVVHKLSECIHDTSHSIKEHLQNVVDDLLILYEMKAGIGYSIQLAPSMSIIIVRIIDKEQVEIFTLGDCTCLINIDDCSLLKIQDVSVPKMDEEVLNLMRKKLEEENYKTLKQTRLDKEINEKMRSNRMKKNTEAGYWILDLTGKGIEHGLLATYSVDQIKDILLMTDGFYEGKEFFMKTGLSEVGFFTLCKELDLVHIGTYIAKQYRKDIDCKYFERVTAIDDVTAIFATLYKKK